MGIITRYYRFMSAYGLPSSRNSLGGELNYQCGRLLWALPLAGLSWLAYLDSDLALNPGNPAIPALRLLLPLGGLLLVPLKSLRRFWHRPLPLLLAFMVLLELDTALITGLSGGQDMYVGGMLFILTLIPVCPIPLAWSLGILGSSVAAFWGVALLAGFSIHDPASAYSAKDLLFTTLVSGLFSILLARLRARSWRQHTLVREQKTRLARDHHRLGLLLRSLVPAELLQNLEDQPSIHPVRFPEVSLVVLEISGQPREGQILTPEILEAYEQVLLASFRGLKERLGYVELKSIAGHWLFALGLPDFTPGHPVKAVLAALQMLELIRLRNGLAGQGAPGSPVWVARAGIHTGPLLATAIESKDYLYDVLGPSTATAGRLKSLAGNGQILLSGSTARVCRDFFDLEEWGRSAAPGGGPGTGHSPAAVALPAYRVAGLADGLSSEGGRIFPNETFRALFAQQFNVNPAHLSL